MDEQPQQLSLKMVAEGAEIRDDMHKAVAAGYNVDQGFLFPGQWSKINSLRRLMRNDYDLNAMT